MSRNYQEMKVPLFRIIRMKAFWYRFFLLLQEAICRRGHVHPECRESIQAWFGSASFHLPFGLCCFEQDMYFIGAMRRYDLDFSGSFEFDHSQSFELVHPVFVAR